MTQHLVEGVVHWLNALPPSNGISKTLSPRNIVAGSPKPDFSKNKFGYGKYAMVYTETRNNMNTRAVPAIALTESNDQGGNYFMSLYTGRE
eukprot:2180737-Ditylum_brightwellii.AAC.1